MSVGKQAIGLGKVTDADIMKAMSGKEGEKAINNMTRTFLDDPQAYNNYVQFVREVQKVNDNIEPVDQETFENKMGAMISDFIDSEEQGKKGEELLNKINTKIESKTPQPDLAAKIAEAMAKRQGQ